MTKQRDRVRRANAKRPIAADVRFRLVPSTPEQADAIAELIVELLDLARSTRGV